MFRSVQRGMSPAGRRGGFTLVELLVVVSVVGVLCALIFPAVWRMRMAGAQAKCAHSLRQLATATHLYLGDNNQRFFPYYEDLPTGERRWYFGVETLDSMGGAEGSRSIDTTQSPLYPYIGTVGGVEVCSAFPYGSRYWKPKYKGASYGYGMNFYLSPLERPAAGTVLRPTAISALTIKEPSKIMLFGDCAQINTFQSPASVTNPLLEEFYFFDESAKTTHFRHNGLANILFVDGHVQSFRPHPGTMDTRLSSQNVGRFTAPRSKLYLTE